MSYATLQLERLAAVERASDHVGSRFQMLMHMAAKKALRIQGAVIVGDAEFNRLNEAMADVAARAYAVELDYVRNYFPDPNLELSFKSDAAKAARRLKMRLGDLKQRFVTPTGRTLRRSIVKLSQDLNGSIRDILEKNVSKAASEKLLNDRLKDLGLKTDNRLPGVAKTWLRTGANSALHAAIWEGTQNNEAVWGYEYRTMLDDRVRPQHAELEGYIRRKEDPVWQVIFPPNGWNCRCQVSPISHEDKTRQSRKKTNVEELVDPEFIGASQRLVVV